MLEVLSVPQSCRGRCTLTRQLPGRVTATARTNALQSDGPKPSPSADGARRKSEKSGVQKTKNQSIRFKFPLGLNHIAITNDAG